MRTSSFNCSALGQCPAMAPGKWALANVLFGYALRDIVQKSRDETCFWALRKVVRHFYLLHHVAFFFLWSHTNNFS